MLLFAKREKGFTLIELLVVVAIIGILSSVILGSLAQARIRARDARRLADIKQIQTALDLYADEHGNQYPDDIYSTTVGLAPTSGKMYIAAVPKDPRGSNYLYANLAFGNGACSVATGFCGTYVLGAVMEGVVPYGDVDGALVGSGADSVNCTDSSPGNNPNNFCVQP